MFLVYKFYAISMSDIKKIEFWQGSSIAAGDKKDQFNISFSLHESGLHDDFQTEMYAKTQEEAVEEFQALMSSIAEHYEVEYFDCAETRLASLKAKMEECIPDVQK